MAQESRQLASNAVLLLMAEQLKIGIFTIDLHSSDVKLMRVQACSCLQLRRWLHAGKAQNSIQLTYAMSVARTPQLQLCVPARIARASR